MATVLDIITRAMRLIRVSGRGDALDAETSAEAVDAFNDMLHEWKLSGVDVTHTDLTASDTFPLADEYRAGVAHMLAGRMRPNYARPREFDEDDFFRRIQAAYLVISEVTFSRGITDLPSNRGSDSNAN